MGAGIPQDKKKVRKGYSLIQRILHLKGEKMFIFKEGLIRPAFYSPQLMEDNDYILPIMPLVPGYPCSVPGPVPGYPRSVPACLKSDPKFS